MASAGSVPSGKKQGEGEEQSSSPGELVLKKLFAQFVVTTEAKLKFVASQPLANPLSKYLQRGDDPNLDQLLASLKEVARFSLRSMLTVLFEWRKRLMREIQGRTAWSVSTGDLTDSPQILSKKEIEYYSERQQLAVEFLFCMTLTEILQQLPIHPVPESFIHNIEELAFNHFKAQEPLKERSTNNPNVANAKRVADLYAEVIGVLSQVRFLSVRMRFFAELRNPQNSVSVIISVIEGLSFVRVKMYPVEELEGWFAFLQDCANYMLETTRGEKVRHAMSALLVEILTPVAAVVKYEVSMPAFRKIVQTLYAHAHDQAKKPKHSPAYIPLVTALLAISEDAFFLNNWHSYVTHVIFQNLRKNDTKLQWIALDSLYRLLWVYMIRIKGEGNVTTFSRLRPIVELLFPRSSGSKFQHKEFPPNIFVKIIYFIARERVEYAMPEIVLDLVVRNKGILNPERAIIGLRAFLMIADSLEKNEGDPPMPSTISTSLSGSVTRTKTKFLTSTLTEQIAKKIGIATYYPAVRQALTSILRNLDYTVGRPLVSTNYQAAKAPEDALSGERKSKLDLLKTCIAAIPRLLPDGMSKEDLIEYISRLTIHIDGELVKMAVTALLNILTNCPSWRSEVVQVFSIFVMRDIPDSCPLVLEGSLKVLGQLLSHWKSLVSSTSEEVELPYVAMATVEACALVTFCSYRSMTRRLSLAILKEVRSCLETLRANKSDAGPSEVRVMDVLEKATPNIIKSYLGVLTQKERADLRINQQNLNLWWLADRNACFLEHGGSKESLRDAWSQCIVGLLEHSVLPSSCPLAIQLTWPYILNRMMKAYSVIDSNFIPHERTDRPPQLRIPRVPFISQPELFLWRNYLFFACCTAPPSSRPHPVPPTPGLYEAGMLLGDKHPRQYTARDLVHMVAPLLRAEGEIGEVVITALGLSNPMAFGDLIEELRIWINDALDLRKSDNVKKRRRRETERVHITRVLSVGAEHGCFHLCPSSLTREGEITKEVKDFISGIKVYLESESDRATTDRLATPTPNNDLRLHYATLISSIINSFPEGQSRARLLPRELRHSLFFMIAGWAGGFWHQPTDTQESEQRVVKQLRSTAFISAVLHAMSALVCCGPIFDHQALIIGRYIYRWLENMLCSSEEKIQQLGQRTVQLLLEYNREPVLLNWVIDHCYTFNSSCACLCFHALSNTFARNPSYPCNMITVLHVILYYTASHDHRARERALQLLHILDRRFFVGNDKGSRRPELLGRITGSAFSNIHVAVSEELAFTNPELTLPLFSEMVYRFEEAPSPIRQSILQLMRPWLRNIELVEENPRPQTNVMPDHIHSKLSTSKSNNPVLSGSGWGSLEGTHLVLHNLLYLTTKYGDLYSADIESLWTALSTWPFNIKVVLNYLARLSCLAGNMTGILKQAKRIIIYFSHTHSTAIVHELMRELQCVELITAELLPLDAPPYYRMSGRGSDSLRRDSRPVRADIDEAMWAMTWRVGVQSNEGQATPLPLPSNMSFYASMKDALKLPCRQVAHLHRSNFALILLSEIVGDIVQFDWLSHLPIMLHVVTLGLDLHRPIVYQHSKKLLCSLTVLLACRDDYKAACEARLTQHETFLHSPSLLSLTSTEGGELQRCGSLNSLETGREGVAGQTSLARKARSLIKYISEREMRKAWPFIDLSSSRDIPLCDVSDLCTLVDLILSVFEPTYTDSLKDKWSKTALQWATSCSSQQFASQSFQLCRALQVPLSSIMLREVLPRLAESVSDHSDELRNYVIEIMLSLENALNNSKDDMLHPPGFLSLEVHGRQASDITPLPEDTTGAIGVSSLMTTPSFVRTLTPTNSVPSSRTQIPLVQSCKTSTPTVSIVPLEPPIEEPPPSPPHLPARKFTHHRRTHSRGQSVTKLELQSVLEPPQSTDPTHFNNEDMSSQDSALLSPDRVHSPPAAGAAPPTNIVPPPSRLKTSSSLDIDSEVRKPLPWETDTPTPQGHRVTSSAKEGVVRKESAPPIHLMNLFEPLPGVKVPTTTVHHSRPYSEVFPSSLTITTTPSTHKDTVLSSLPSIAVTKASAPPIGTTPTQLATTPPTSLIITSTVTPPIQLTSSVPISTTSYSQSGTTPPTQLSTTPPTQLSTTPPTQLGTTPPTQLGTTPLTQLHAEFRSLPPQITTTSSTPPQQATPTNQDSTLIGDVSTSTMTTPKQEEEEDEDTEESPLSRSHGGNTSGSSIDSSNIIRVPSHPELRGTAYNSSKLFPDSSPIIRARSVTHLQSMDQGEGDRQYKRRSYSGSRETVPGYTPSSLTKEQTPHVVRGSLERLHSKGDSTQHTTATHTTPMSSFQIAPPIQTNLTSSITLPNQTSTAQYPQVAPPTHRLPLSHQNSPTKEGLRRRTSADPDRERAQSAGSKGRSRPRSMFETSSAAAHTSLGAGDLMASSDLLSQLFWTSVSLMYSDYEMEFSLSLRLFNNVCSRLDFKSDLTFARLDMIRFKSNWEGFPGVLRVILKGLSLTGTTHSTRRLISKLCPYARRQVFDPSGIVGLPLCIMSLLPELILHFESPTDEVLVTAGNIAEACTSFIPHAQSNELVQVLRDMGHLFHLYSKKEFSNSRSIWLKSVCHYISKGYATVTQDILKFMGVLLDQGCDTYHQSVLWIVNDFLIKLEENSTVDMGLVTETITKPVSHFIKGPLWQEALGILSLVVKSSSSLVQPTTPHIPMVDLGFFQESLPGPTLQFSVDLTAGSHDLKLANEATLQSSWRRPQGCQKITREKLLKVINACGPLQNLYTSPSVIFTDNQVLLTRTIFSESEEEEEEEETEESESDMRASSEILDSSQPESAVINTIGDTFDFLNQYSDQEESEEEDVTGGPFSVNKDDTYISSSHSSLSSNPSSLDEEETQDHTHYRESSQEPSQSIDIPLKIQQHSRSASPTYLPRFSPQSFEVQGSSPRQLSLERSLDDSYEATPPRSEEYGVRFMDEPLEATPTQQNNSQIDMTITQDTPPTPTDTPSFETPPTDTPSFETPPTEILSYEPSEMASFDETVPSEIPPFEIPPTEYSSIGPTTTTLSIKIPPAECLSNETPPTEGLSNETPPTEGLSNETPPTEGLSNEISSTEALPTETPPTEGLSNEIPPTETLPNETPPIDAPLTETSPTDTLSADIPLTKSDISIEAPSTESDVPSTESDTLPTTESDSLTSSETTPINIEPVTEETDGITSDITMVTDDVTMETSDVVITTSNVAIETSGVTMATDEITGEEKADEFVIIENLEEELPTDDEIKEIEEEKDVKDTEKPHPLEIEPVPPITEPHPHEPPELHPPESQVSTEEPRPSVSFDLSDDEEDTSLPPRVDLHRASHFICIADEEIEEVWQEHVNTLSRSRNPSLAVNTFYLFHRLFLVIRQQTCTLTREATSYMNETLWNISTHFLVTVELLMTELQLPRVYLDIELISSTNLLDSLVFFVLEIQNNLEHFEAQRATLLQNISECKKAVLSSYSSPPPSPSPLTSFTPHQRSLTLCYSVHQIHFQLLLLVSSYIKLLHLLINTISSSPLSVTNITTQLTDVHRELSHFLSSADKSHDLMVVGGSGLGREEEKVVRSMKADQAMRYLQDTVASNKTLLAIQLLYTMRTYYCDEQLFGAEQSDTLDVLFYGYAHCIAEGKEGVVGITSSEHNLIETHSHLMTQNVSLLTLLEKQQLPELNTETSPPL